MHLTLKKEATKPPGKNFLQQQAKFDHFIDDYNQERPHQALNMQYPADSPTLTAALYRPPGSTLPVPRYDHHRDPMWAPVLWQA